MTKLSPLQAEVLRRRNAGESVRHIGRVLGINVGTVAKHYSRALAKTGEARAKPLPHQQRAVIPEPLPDDLETYLDDLPEYERVKRRLADCNQRHIDGFDRGRHLRLTVPHAPFLQFFIGDLHRDSPGHDDVQFERDMEIIRQAQTEFTTHVVNMGDILDNWPTNGRLAKKHHDSHLTRKEALALVRGFLQEEGLEFTLHLLGNHDTFPDVDFATLMRQWTSAPVVDWAAYLTVTTEKGWAFTVFAAHDMRGSSIHNPVHGLARRAREDGSADLYVAAHRHTGGQGKDEHGFRGRMYNYLRVRGYKRADEYAWAKGFPEESEGCTGMAVVNPDAKTLDGRVRTFYDLSEGLDWAGFIASR